MILTTRALTGLTLIVLSLLLLAPAHASPALSLGNTAAYTLTASVKTVQSCSATANEGYACGTLPPSNNTAIISVLDNGVCSLNSTASASCRFDPAIQYATAGETVRWTNNGLLTHLVTSDTPGTYLYGYMSTGQSYATTFQTQGSYAYHCSIHPWMKGQVQLLAPPPPVPSPPTTMQFDVSGPVSWKVVGLDNNTALLNVSHQLSLTLNLAGLPVTPASEAGSFEQSINLFTREESAGTATALIKAVLEEYATALSRTSYYGYYSQLSSVNIPDTYTIWWVNGPLKKGSPVELLNGYSSVLGSETISLGGTIGNRDAWKVGSSFTQSIRVTTPQPSFGNILPLPPPSPPPSIISTNSADLALSLQFNYDKTNDLLLHSNSTISIVQTTQILYQPGYTICTNGYPNVCVQLTTMTTVTHQTTANISVQMQLTSTDLPFNHGAAPNTQTQGPTTPTGSPVGPSSTSASASPLLLYGSISAVALGIVGAALWVILRNPSRRGKPTDTVPSLPVS